MLYVNGGGRKASFYCLEGDDENMFAEFLVKNEFYKQYMQLYTTRSAIANLEMENNQTDVTMPNRTIEMYNSMHAFMKIIEKNPERISPYDVIDIADDVNKDLNFFDHGYRKTQVEVRRATKFFPIAARNIPMKMYSLFDTYHNTWNILPVYEKEARLHIELVRIQPFEDGNKRTARILTNYNLCRQNKAPVVISGAESEEYFQFIDNYAVEQFAQFLEKKSKEELQVMIDLYQRVCGDSSLDGYSSQASDIEFGEIAKSGEYVKKYF